MKKSKDEVLEILSTRNISKCDFSIGIIDNEPLYLWVIIDTITWKELSNEWLRENIIDIQPWDENNIRISIDNVY